MPKKFDESEIKNMLEQLKENNFNFHTTAKELGINQQTLQKIHRDHGKRVLGEVRKFANIPSLKPLVERQVDKAKKDLYKDRLKALEGLTSPSKAVIKADQTIAECNAKIASKSANIKLRAMERLESLLEFVNTDQLLRVIEVLNRVDTEPREDVKKKTSSFLQIVAKQAIINNIQEKDDE